ncbi:PP2C family protein-serine/threonine phosphatase [Sphingomonas sp. Y38-1Y]|uniref:PP2C family protein-serine/threonine phosphatase n=1 Tax=Sphingomonas sp. Y38-1Y TaxID=3078265 RepID=UPI0028EB7E15|nr:protein phosphatase 2C domain-containing protein [Sphingomonas sp. Y38-1Y]
MTGPRIDAHALTHVGRVRKNNEDSFCERPRDGLWAVADGMGGHERGEVASAAIVEALHAAPLTGQFDDDAPIAADAIHAANARIWAEGQERGGQMGSTVVALLLRGWRFAVLWVGDSRAYLLRGGTLYQLTRDHSQVQDMVDRGLLSEADAAGHPMSHVLARAVGVRPETEVDIVADEAVPGDVFLLCSDGLSGPLADAEIAGLLRTGDAQAAERLVAATLDRGAPDNVTIVVVALNETTSLSFAEPVSGPSV